jgi:hypothetical protein
VYVSILGIAAYPKGMHFGRGFRFMA